jgi:hypothetical protein|tara:strand:- start:2332 stop:3078 length:747 start_codon:yes stop_codon:yes gene_type:complete
MATAGDSYLKMMQGSMQAPATMSDYQAEAERLGFLIPETRKTSIYDLASDLSAGLTAQAQSGQPASIGYGLASGFNRFNEAQQLKRAAKDKYKQQLMMMAYESVEKKRAEAKELAQKAGTYDFEIALEQAKNSGQGIFGGLSSVEGRALDFLARLKKNPNLKNTNRHEYDAAVAYLGGKFKTITVDGNTISVPVYDTAKLFGTPAPSSGGIPSMPASVNNQGDYDAWVATIPSGSQYKDSNGQLRTKP